MLPQFFTKLFESLIVVVAAFVLWSIVVLMVLKLVPLREPGLLGSLLHSAVICLVPFTLGGFLLASSWIRIGSCLVLGLFVVVSAIDYTFAGAHGAEITIASYIQHNWPAWIAGFSAAIAGLALGAETNKRMLA